MNKIEAALQRTTDTRDLIIGVGAMKRTPEMFQKLFPGKKAVIVADTTTYRVAGEEVARHLAEAGVAAGEPFIFDDPHLYGERSYGEQLEA